MTTPNHITGGIVFTGLFCSLFSINIFANPIYISITIIGSLIPDVDHTKSIIGKFFYPIAKWLSVKFGHRTITHSIFFLGIITLFSVFTDKIFFNNYNITIIIFFSVFSHLLFDMMTLQGIPLFYPIYKNPCVLPANPELRIRTGNLKQEGIILFIFSLMTVFMQDLFLNGFWSTLNKSFGSISHIHKEAKTTTNFLKIDYNYFEFGENKTGTAFLISSTKNQITLFGNNQIFTIDKTNGNHKKIKLDFKKTNSIYKYKTIEITDFTTEKLNEITRNKIVKGYIKSNQKFTLNNSLKAQEEINLNNNYNAVFSFISSDTLKKKLKKELKLKQLKLKTIQQKNYKSISKLNEYKSKLKTAKNMQKKTQDLYLKNKYENEIIKLKTKIDNYNIDLETSSEIKAEIKFTKELINEENINYFSGTIEILQIPKE